MQTLFTRARNILLASLVIWMAFSFSSCARKIAFNISSIVPAAEANVKLTKDRNKNFVINLSVSNLSEPTRLSPSKESYVVWIQTENNGLKNIGQLKTSTGLFSNALKGSLKAVTPFKPTKVFITAENSTDIQTPGTFTVLTTDSF